jgi:hypothetical protein
MLIAIVVYLGQRQGWFPMPSCIWAMLLYFILSTAIIFFVLQRPLTPAVFTQMYLLTMVLKLITACMVILIVIFIDRSGAIANAALFIISYFLYTTLEVVFLYKK